MDVQRNVPSNICDDFPDAAGCLGRDIHCDMVEDVADVGDDNA
jgi:hypothetical protein